MSTETAQEVSLGEGKSFFTLSAAYHDLGMPMDAFELAEIAFDIFDQIESPYCAQVTQTIKEGTMAY